MTTVPREQHDMPPFIMCPAPERVFWSLNLMSWLILGTTSEIHSKLFVRLKSGSCAITMGRGAFEFLLLQGFPKPSEVLLFWVVEKYCTIFHLKSKHCLEKGSKNSYNIWWNFATHFSIKRDFQTGNVATFWFRETKLVGRVLMPGPKKMNLATNNHISMLLWHVLCSCCIFI